MDKEELLLQKRLVELANRSYTQNMFTFTDFLSLSQLDLFYRNEPQLSFAGVTVFGGSEGVDRKVIRFGNPKELGYEECFPIKCIFIEPVIEKFGEHLSHRDYLGALMNLGIERANLGDIYIEGKKAYVFCLERISSYIMENITQVRHTQVKTGMIEIQGLVIKKHVEEMVVLTSSERIDSVIAKIFHLSRSQSMELFREKKIYVNSRICENNSYMIKEKDEISVRGFGKFIYYGVNNLTKKGKLSVKVGIYK